MRTATRRRLVLVHEQQEDKGGGPLESIQAECPEGLRQDIFEGRTPITWHRVSHYQNLTLKLIATEMLRQGPKYSSSLSITGEEEPPLTLVLPGEVSASELAMPRPVTLWCSTGNPGAEDFARELATAMAGGEESIRVVTRRPDAATAQPQIGPQAGRSAPWTSSLAKASYRSSQSAAEMSLSTHEDAIRPTTPTADSRQV